MEAKRKSYVLLYLITAILVLLIGALVYVLIMQIRARETEEEVDKGFSRETHTVESLVIGGSPGAIGIFDETGNRYILIGIVLGIYRERTMDFAEYNALIAQIRDNYTRVWSITRDVMREIGVDGLEGLPGQQLLGERLLEQLRELFETERIAEVMFTNLTIS